MLNAHSRNPFLIIAGQFPPPVNGFAFITQEIAKALAQKCETNIIDLATHPPRRGPSYHLRRLGLTLKGLAPLLKNALKKNKRFYIACEGGLGLVYTLALCSAARLLGYPIFIHHHSYFYVDQKIFLMRLLLSASGPKASHIVLCKEMARAFAARYGRKIVYTVLSNSAFVAEAPGPLKSRDTTKSLTIGLLGNLNDEKGLSLFIETIRRLRADGLKINATLAGPPVSDCDRLNIEAACKEFGDALTYKGPLYGKAKTDFFKSLDLFVFPTHYANEAQPTVIF